MHHNDRNLVEALVKRRYSHWTSQMRDEFINEFLVLEKRIEEKYFPSFGTAQPCEMNDD